MQEHFGELAQFNTFELTGNLLTHIKEYPSVNISTVGLGGLLSHHDMTFGHSTYYRQPVHPTRDWRPVLRQKE